MCGKKSASSRRIQDISKYEARGSLFSVPADDGVKTGLTSTGVINLLVTRTSKTHFNTSIVKPTRCASFSNLFYFGAALCTFRTVFSVHHQESKTVHTASGICQTDAMLACSQKTPDDGHKDRPKHAECYSKMK